MKPKIKYQVIYKHKDKYSISQMRKFFSVSRSGYYAFLKRLDIPDRDLPLAEKYENVRNKAVTHTVIKEYIYGLKGKEYTETQRLCFE